MQKITYWIRNFFGFNHRETTGFILLTLFMILIVAFPFLYDHFLPSSDISNPAEKAKLDSMMLVLEKNALVKTRETKQAHLEKPATQLFDFDPNQISADQWKLFGLAKPIAERVVKYREKGGKFRTKKDLLKIYGFPVGLYEQLYSHIQLPDSISYISKNVEKLNNTIKAEAVSYKKPEKPVLARFDLNKADTVQLKQIKGIGPALSKRIIKYRDLLGGFIHVNQVKEVYGLDSIVVNILLQHGFIQDNTPVKKINVNTASAEELDAHPYITPKIAKVIVSYRQQHGNYTSHESLYEIRILDQSTLSKLTPYLSFE